MDEPKPRRILELAAVLAWSAAILPVVFACARTGEVSTLDGVTVGAGAVFFVAFVVGLAIRDSTSWRWLGAVQSLSAVLAASASDFGLTPVLLVIVATQAPRALSGSSAAMLVGVQTALWIMLSLVLRPGVPLLVLVAAYAGFQLFALASRVAEENEAIARRELAKAHAALTAAQVGREEAERTRERLRIARELHDSVGHQLTALHLSLELVANTDGAPHDEAVQRSRGLVRDVLSDVRAVVSGMRSETPFDLAAALQSLGGGVRSPQVHLSADAAERLTDAAFAHCLFRCAQEGLTNALRHAAAKNIWVELTHVAKTWRLAVRNDGDSRPPARPGNGLLGARERAEELGGTLESMPLPAGGWELVAMLPEER
ncbi:sensor histidine kinase [soil metagenome]